MLRPAAYARRGQSPLLLRMLRPAAYARRGQSPLLLRMLRPAAYARRRQSPLLLRRLVQTEQLGGRLGERPTLLFPQPRGGTVEKLVDDRLGHRLDRLLLFLVERGELGEGPFGLHLRHPLRVLAQPCEDRNGGPLALRLAQSGELLPHDRLRAGQLLLA